MNYACYVKLHTDRVRCLEFSKEIKGKMGWGIFEGKITEKFPEMFVEEFQTSEPGSPKSPKKNK